MRIQYILEFAHIFPILIRAFFHNGYERAGGETIEMKYFGEVFSAEGGGISSVVLNEELEYVTCSVGLVDASQL